MQTPSEPMRSETRSVFGNFADAGEDEASFEQPTVSRAAASAPQSLQDQINEAVARSFLHRFVAKLFEYPSEESWSWLTSGDTAAALESSCAVLHLCESAEQLLAAIRATSFDAFLDAHLSAFGHAARGPVPMNEIEYGDLKADPLFQPHRLADLAAFYRAFGLEIAPDASERQDHVCIEFEFMSVLAAKEAFAHEHQLDDDSLATCRAAQREFLREHLGRWLPAFTRRVERANVDALLNAIAQFTRDWVLNECRRLAVRAGNEDLVLRPVDSEAEQLCASCGIRDLPPGAASGE